MQFNLKKSQVASQAILSVTQPSRSTNPKQGCDFNAAKVVYPIKVLREGFYTLPGDSSDLAQ
jgi:hypothetical protein